MEVDKSIVITDEVVDSILEDWFERDGETFVKITKKGRLGWEKTLEEGESYSAYILESPTKEDLIKRAYSLAKETIAVMDPPFKVMIKITNDSSGTSGTDGKVVYLNTAMFDDEELTVGERLDTFLGVTVHEGCHLLYTDLEWLKKIKNPIVKQIWNILEDERIEQLCGMNKPGLANFLEKSKYYYFDQYYLDYVVPMEKEGKLTPLMRILNCLLHIIRYPKYLDEKEIIEFAHYLLEIKKLVLPYPKTTEETVKLSYKIFDLIKEFYEKKEIDELSDDDKESAEKEAEAVERATKKLDEDFKSASEALSKVSSAPTSAPVSDGGGLGDKDISSVVSSKGGLLGEICEGKVELGASKDTYFTRMEDAQSVYMASLSRIKKYIPAIAKILKGHCKEYKLIHRSMRSGVLDTNKLVEAVQGVPTVYIREGEVKTDKISVAILIDESGSMSGSRIQAARDTAVLINEAIGSIPNIELYIYGHSGDMRTSYATELYVYREKDFTPRFSLGSVKARCQNRDGIAILEVAKRVRSQSKNPVLFFILSDGAPCAGGYGGESAMTHVRNCVNQAEKMGFHIIQVCINHSYDPAKMFRNFIILEDMSRLAFDLGKAIKKAAMTAAKVNIS